MQESDWTHTLFLLAAMVIVDGRIFKEEVDTFVRESVTLSADIKIDVNFSTKIAFDWFVINRDSIKLWAKSSKSETELLTHVMALKDNPFRTKILTSMANVAIADGNLHRSEHKTLTLTAKGWGLELPKLET